MANVLTEQLLLSKVKAQSLSEIRNVNMWGKKLRDVSIIAQLSNVETIALSVNEVASLEPFGQCKNLRELFLRKNTVTELKELFFLRGVQQLRVLWLSDNPISTVEDYRLFTIAVLPQLTKLDEVDITAEEREQARTKFPDPGVRVGMAPAVPAKAAASPAKAAAPPADAIPGVSQQGYVLAAIEILMRDLDNGNLDRVAEIVARRRKA